MRLLRQGIIRLCFFRYLSKAFYCVSHEIISLIEWYYFREDGIELIKSYRSERIPVMTAADELLAIRTITIGRVDYWSITLSDIR